MIWISVISTIFMFMYISWNEMFYSYIFHRTFVISQSVMFLSYVSEYPYELHDLYKDYLFPPERLQIKENIFSDYQSHLLQDEGFSKPPPKLVSNLRNKANYIIHYRNLKLWLERFTNVLPTFIVFCHLINHHGWKTTSTSTFIKVQLLKMILKSWWTARSLVSLLYVYLLFYDLIYLFIQCR